MPFYMYVAVNIPVLVWAASLTWENSINCTWALKIVTLVLYYSSKNPCRGCTPTMGESYKLHLQCDSHNNLAYLYPTCWLLLHLDTVVEPYCIFWLFDLDTKLCKNLLEYFNLSPQPEGYLIHLWGFPWMQGSTGKWHWRQLWTHNLQIRVTGFWTNRPKEAHLWAQIRGTNPFTLSFL